MAASWIALLREGILAWDPGGPGFLCLPVSLGRVLGGFGFPVCRQVGVDGSGFGGCEPQPRLIQPTTSSLVLECNQADDKMSLTHVSWNCRINCAM